MTSTRGPQSFSPITYDASLASSGGFPFRENIISISHQIARSADFTSQNVIISVHAKEKE